MADAASRLEWDLSGPNFPAQSGAAVQEIPLLRGKLIRFRVARIAFRASSAAHPIHRIEIRFAEG